MRLPLTYDSLADTDTRTGQVTTRQETTPTTGHHYKGKKSILRKDKVNHLYIHLILLGLTLLNASELIESFLSSLEDSSLYQTLTALSSVKLGV